MKNINLIIVAACLAIGFASKARADYYPDSTGELFTMRAQQLDIASVVVTNDSTSIYFTIGLVGNPQAAIMPAKLRAVKAPRLKPNR